MFGIQFMWFVNCRATLPKRTRNSASITVVHHSACVFVKDEEVRAKTLRTCIGDSFIIGTVSPRAVAATGRRFSRTGARAHGTATG